MLPQKEYASLDTKQHCQQDCCCCELPMLNITGGQTPLFLHSREVLG